MVEIGYALSSEEHAPNDLICQAHQAEEAGFTFALISDHYHPWISRQGQSPFVWSVIGGIAQATQHLRLGTGVTCPTTRIHPAIIAQAAATAAVMMPGRFFLGVGAGENLNEHVLGDRWPPYELRRQMLEEAVEVIRLLLDGQTETYSGEFYLVEDARLFTVPAETLPIMLAAEEGVELVILCAHGRSGKRKWPFGSVAGTFIEYGATPLLIIQDLSPDEVEPTPAEQAAKEVAGHV
jgi:G6PDH family F420-dependent oxidoreductase